MTVAWVVCTSQWLCWSSQVKSSQTNGALPRVVVYPALLRALVLSNKTGSGVLIDLEAMLGVGGSFGGSVMRRSTAGTNGRAGHQSNERARARAPVTSRHSSRWPSCMCVRLVSMRVVVCVARGGLSRGVCCGCGVTRMSGAVRRHASVLSGYACSPLLLYR